MNWYETLIFELGSKIQDFGRLIKRIGHWVGTVALKLRARRYCREYHRAIRQQLPPTTWPEHEPWHDNFTTRAGEHEHV